MIKPDQLTAYDDASKVIERAAQTLETINLARLDAADRERVCALITEARQLRHALFSAAHDCYLSERGLK